MQPPEPAPSQRAPAVDVRGITRRFGTVEALRGINLVIQPGEFFSLLGPSGCGKTTLLRIVAGLEMPDAGVVSIDGVDVSGVPAHRRPVNTVFQSYALFPHMDVRGNVGFGLRMKNRPPAEIRERVDRALDLVQVASLADRRPTELSGGQKQRVALARALVNEPRVLLLDEPLGALDLQLRRHLQGELHALQRRLGITFVHVTHDQEEALALSDRIAVMSAGRIEQVGDARTLYERPATRFVAEFLGTCNVLEVSSVESGGGAPVVVCGLGSLRVADMPDGARAAATRPRVAIIRPEHLRIRSSAGPAAPNEVAAQVTDVSYTGAQTRLKVEARGLTLEVLLVNGGPQWESWCPGQAATLVLPPEAIRVLPG